jgi:hypothetical protein
MTESNPTAYREAGHAVAALLLTDCPFDTVTIVPGNPSIGDLARQHLLGEIILEYDDEIRQNRNLIKDAIHVSLAGPYAQRRHDSAFKWRRGRDRREASDLIYCLYKHYHTSAKVIPSFWRHTNVILDDFLEGHWNAIETLAHRLIRHRTVSRDEAAAAALEMAIVDFTDGADLSSMPSIGTMMGLNRKDR